MQTHVHTLVNLVFGHALLPFEVLAETIIIETIFEHLDHVIVVRLDLFKVILQHRFAWHVLALIN